MKNKFIPISLALALTAGCSSIVSKSDYPVTINSSPDGAGFIITNRAGQKVQSGLTPATVTLKSSSGYFKGETYTIELNKDGYSSKTYTLTSSVDGWYFGNILFGGIIGMLIIDPATGAMYNLQERADISLDPQSASTISSETFTIATVDSLTADQIARLERLQ